MDPTGGTPGGMAVGAIAGAIVMKVVDWFLNRRRLAAETDANVDLLQNLREGMAAQREELSSIGNRVKAMEEEAESLRKRLEDEIARRQQAQEEAHTLRLRVQTLESAMRSIGAVIPPDVG